MIARNHPLAPAVAAFLAARSPGWQHRVRVGKSGGRSVPVPCEVCGRITYRPVVELEYRARHGRSLPRFCSNRCQRVGNARARAGGVPAAVERFLAARLPDWRDRARIGACGGKAFPIPCEVCGTVTYHPAGVLATRARRGLPLPRYCSIPCSVQGRAAARREGRA